ncbi:H-NS histone family protein [Massilia orientalis]|uniref:H-NS family nucleoid-associated regulatory protein n=1 Tax=Massilia orientalis TaxID=3050128 RepID=A0ACC7MQ75_9BURK|nr:H-NS histone family protein [Massilia sp. YIM B02787]
MAVTDLSKLNLSELKGLQHDIEQEIKNREQEEVRKAREKILSIAQSVGLPVEQLIANVRTKPKAAKASTVRAQYRNPADNEQTWTGRGRKPRWVIEAVEQGKSLDEFRI